MATTTARWWVGLLFAGALQAARAEDAVQVWRLDTQKLGVLLPTLTGPDAAAPGRPPWAVWLQALVGVDFPTAALFTRALQEQACPLLPRPSASAPAGQPPPPAWCSDPAFQQQVQQVLAAAQDSLPQRPAWPLNLQAKEGCLCVPADPSKEVQGMLGWWQGDARPQRVDFALFNRLTLMTAALREDGSLWQADVPGLLSSLRAARSRGTAVDLGVIRQGAAGLGAWPAARVQAFIERSASAALQMLQQPVPQETPVWQRLLIPPLRERELAYSGLTVFFDDTAQDPADREAQARLAHGFAMRFLELARQANAPGRAPPLRLNIVLTDQQAQEQGALGIAGLVALLQEANRGTEHQARSGVDLRFLVLLSEPTSDSKKALRQRLDRSGAVKGESRVELLQHILPLLLVGQEDTWPQAASRKQQLDDDLAYAQWTYGGVALWSLPAPVAGQGGAISQSLRDTFGAQPDGQLMGWVRAQLCLHRAAWSLALQVLVLALVLSLGLLLARGLFRKRRAQRQRP